MELDKQWSSSLRPDAQAYDEIRITTVPRWKESELSGDEWRISASVQLLRKGQVVKERGYGDVESAAKFLSWFMVETVEDGGGNFGGDGDLCDQEGCAESATVFYQKKKEWCRSCATSKEITYRKYFRKFCERHKHRGDCGLDDADDNYVLLPSDPRASAKKGGEAVK